MSVAVPLHEIRAEFAELDDPVDRTTYLIEVGRTLPPLEEHHKTEENRVLGCQARVWLIPEERAGPPRTLEFLATYGTVLGSPVANVGACGAHRRYPGKSLD